MLLQTYQNSLGLLASGSCCSGQKIPASNCTDQCNTQIFLCLDSFGSSAESGSLSCPYGSRLLSAINGQNNLIFKQPTFADNENPILIPFSGNYSQIGYRLRITIMDQKTSYTQLIDTIVIDFRIQIPYQSSAVPVFFPFQASGNRTAAPKTKYFQEPYRSATTFDCLIEF